MKRIYFAVVLLAITLGACKKEKAATENSGQENKVITDTVPKTYAEIAIAEGGEWVDGPKGHKEYANGTSFKNVASLKVPKEHTDHSWYIRYEGPGWESNKIGYRLYLDWRNAIDIFGKVTDSLILKNVGQDGFDSYHEAQTWGQDVLKVGKGLGVGSIGRELDGEVLHFNTVDSTFASVSNTLDGSSVNVNYFGWKTGDDTIDLQSTLSIKPDSRITKHVIQASKAIPGICTGIVDHKVDYFSKESEDKEWGYIATYGDQTLVPDKLGMAILYRIEDASKVFKGADDYLIVFKGTTSPVTFYFLGAWEKEQDGIKTKEAFESYLDSLLTDLQNRGSL